MTPPRPVVLVTGAGTRVGRVLALHLASADFDVAVHYHTSEGGARDTVSMCRARGVRSAWFSADLSDADAPQVLVERVVASFGKLDGLVNSAATMLSIPLATITPQQWDRVFAVNVRAPFFLALAASRTMNGGGAIVNISDHLASESWPTLVAHGVSKSAVVSMTELLAKQLAPRVRVNAVAPGAVLAPADWPEAARDRFAAETPMRRLGTPEDVAVAVEYLLRAPYVTGHTLVVDGGRRLR